MIIKLWIDAIITGKRTFEEAPNQLKKTIAEILTQMGFEYLLKKQ